MSGTPAAWGGRKVARLRATLIARDTNPDGTLTCRLCHQPITATDHVEIDHVQGRGHGGTDQLANLRLTHATCNNQRGHDQQRALATANRSTSRTAPPPTRWQRLAAAVTTTTTSDPHHGGGADL